MRRHVLHASYALIPYTVGIGVMQHAMHLGVMARSIGAWLSWLSVLIGLSVYALIRSGWSQRCKDPLLALPHATVSVTLCMAAYVALGQHRADATILLAQTVVLTMLRVRPHDVLRLGTYTVSLLLMCNLGLTLSDPVRFSRGSSIAHFVVAASAIFTLSLICKWISGIRARMSQQARELNEAIGTLEQMATRDMLTGVINRRVMTELAETELRLDSRHDTPVCIALIDIDHFKQVNDRHGHQVGDIVLKAVAGHVQSQLRQVDKLARWGGEEFLLMLPAIALPDALSALERVRLSVENLRFPERAGLAITFSAGLAQARPGESLDQLIERADRALYDAKRQGRNRCILASDTPPSQAVAATPSPGQEVASS